MKSSRGQFCTWIDLSITEIKISHFLSEPHGGYVLSGSTKKNVILRLCESKKSHGFPMKHSFEPIIDLPRSNFLVLSDKINPPPLWSYGWWISALIWANNFSPVKASKFLFANVSGTPVIMHRSNKFALIYEKTGICPLQITKESMIILIYTAVFIWSFYNNKPAFHNLWIILLIDYGRQVYY